MTAEQFNKLLDLEIAHTHHHALCIRLPYTAKTAAIRIPKIQAAIGLIHLNLQTRSLHALYGGGVMVRWGYGLVDAVFQVKRDAAALPLVIQALGETAGLTGTRIGSRDESKRWRQIFSEPPQPFDVAMELDEAMLTFASLAEFHRGVADRIEELDSNLRLGVITEQDAEVQMARVSEQNEAAEVLLARVTGAPLPEPAD